MRLDDTTEILRLLTARRQEVVELRIEVLAEDPTSLVQIDGIATINAAKILAEVGDV